MGSLILFHRPGCLFSARVREYIEEAGLREDVTYRDIESERDPNARSELIRLTGRAQVPCLSVDGEPILESEAIIARLRSFGRARERELDSA